MLAAAVLTIGGVAPGHAVAAQSCSSLESQTACTSSEVGKTCAGTSDICTAYDCSDDGGATTAYRCTFSDAFIGGCGCGVSADRPTPVGVALALALAGTWWLGARRRRRRARR